MVTLTYPLGNDGSIGNGVWQVIPTESQLWRDAYSIAWIGACNPKGVQHTIDRYRLWGYSDSHVAMRAMQGHLDYLKGDSLGPELDVLTEVRDRHNANQTEES